MAEEVKTEVEESVETEKAVDYQALVNEMRIENAKLKKAMDKAMSETADYKKKLREKQTADEIAAQEKAEKDAEREERYNALVRENTINKFEKNFIALGYSQEQANKASVAQLDGDMDSLFAIQKEVQDSLVKAKESEWLKSRPSVQSGVGGGKQHITKEQFENMTLIEQNELFKSNRELYNELAR